MSKYSEFLSHLSVKKRTILITGFFVVLVFASFILNKSLFRFLTFSFIPLCITGCCFVKAEIKLKPVFLVTGILFLTILIHLRNVLFFPPIVFTDSHGYISWGNDFAHGLGFPGMWYRAPLYPFLLGCTFWIGDDSNLQIIVLIQRLLTIADMLIIYVLATRWKLGKAAGLMAALLFSLNSLVMQMSHAVMTESLTLFLVLLSILFMTYLFSKPYWITALLCSFSFAITAYCRQIASPLFFTGLILFIVNDFRKRVVLVFVACTLFFGIEMPWSMRNLDKFGGYGLSYHLGPNIFTKLTSFRLEYKKGPYYSQCSRIVNQIENNLEIPMYNAPEFPEERWDINRIPHLLMDSLIQNYQYTPYAASKLLTKASIEGFCHNIIPYLKSIAATMKSLLFEQHEIPVNLSEIFPLIIYAPYPVRELLRSYAWVNGVFPLIFVLILILKREKFTSTRWLPWYLAFYGYVTTSLVQVGFSRYTVPWIPFMCMLTAYTSVRISGFCINVLNGKILNTKSDKIKS